MVSGKKFYALVKPSKGEEEKLKKLARKFLKKIRIKKAEPVVGGSFAKGTWLRGLHDLDVYVRFDYETYKDVKISNILKRALKKVFKKVTLIRGSRDYYQIRKDNYTIEIVPILAIKKAEEAQNITDISPLHVEWVKKHSGFGDEIRLSKAFCKSLGVYGAESYIRGFSGYVLEILVIHYKSFNNLLKAALKWKAKTIIDPRKYYKGKNVLKELNLAKIQSPLILVDPVQKTRNAAANLNRENYKKFIQAAKKFLKKPSKKFFEKKELNLKELEKKASGKKLIMLEATPLKGREDVVGAKLLKCFKYIEKKLKLEGFTIFESGWKWNAKALYWYIIGKEKLSETKKHYGPPIKYEKRLESFRKKWKNYELFEKKKLSYVILKREFREPNPFLQALTKKDAYIKLKVKNVKIPKSGKMDRKTFK